MKTHRLPLVSFYIGMGFLLTQLSSGIVFPSLPVGVDFFSSTSTHMKSAISYFFSGYAIGQLLWGTLSDRYGRRVMCRAALIIYITAAIIIVITSSLTVYFILYSIIGFGAAAFTSVGNAILKDLFGKDKIAKVIGIIGIVMACGPMLGSALGTPLSHYFGWASIYIFLGILACIILWGFIFFVPETTPAVSLAPPNKSLLRKITFVVSQRQFIRSILILGASFGALCGFLDAAPFLFTGYMHASTREAGWLLMLCSSGYLLGSLVIPVFITAQGISRLMVMGISLFFMSVLLMFILYIVHLNSETLIVAVFLLCLFGLGMLVPLGKAGCMTSNDHYAGMTSSLMKFIQTLFVVATTSIVSILNTSTTLLPVFILLTVSLLIAMLGFIVTHQFRSTNP